MLLEILPGAGSKPFAPADAGVVFTRIFDVRDDGSRGRFYLVPNPMPALVAPPKMRQ